MVVAGSREHCEQLSAMVVGGDQVEDSKVKVVENGSEGMKQFKRWKVS